MKNGNGSTAILLTNLGSPDSTSVPDVRRYLREFLMDERVIDVPWWWRNILVKGIIVPFRAPKSAAAYRSIWTPKGSPLIEITRKLTQLVHEATGLPTYMSMRYGQPRPGEVLQRIAKEHPGLETLVMLPLYPHYAMSSYETAVVQVQEEHRKGGFSFSLKIVQPYYEDPSYIQSLANSLRPYLQDPYDHFLVSYHGIPERHLRKTDPTGCHCLSTSDCCNTPSEAHATCYRHQVFRTTELVTRALGVPAEKHSVSFQSRLGSDPWLQPYTAKELEELPGRGIKRLVIACPAFVSDCLETLEEIQEEGREIFMEAGGESFVVAPCLNLHPDWVRTITILVDKTA
jgi:protoporphyrin/coproporphyrin ferrochelatase